MGTVIYMGPLVNTMLRIRPTAVVNRVIENGLGLNPACLGVKDRPP